MHIVIASIGRMKAGNEREMLERYINRVSKSGKSLGITNAQCIDIAESRASTEKLRKEEEAKKLLSAIPSPNFLVALDERGESITSRSFAKLIGQQINEGHGKLVFAIGGADGLGQRVIESANKILAFGEMTWPHQIARIMLAEQIYRATTILSGHPYHRN